MNYAKGVLSRVWTSVVVIFHLMVAGAVVWSWSWATSESETLDRLDIAKAAVVDLYDKNGFPHQILDSKEETALLSGEFGIPKGATVRFVDSYGHVSQVGMKGLDQAIAAGLHVQTEAEREDLAFRINGDLLYLHRDDEIPWWLRRNPGLLPFAVLLMMEGLFFGIRRWASYIFVPEKT